jgi:hypothetical protein
MAHGGAELWNDGLPNAALFSSPSCNTVEETPTASWDFLHGRLKPHMIPKMYVN